MNYYRRYSGDYLRDTARLNLTEHGAYSLLLDYAYTTEHPLPLDHDELYLMVRAMRAEDRKAVDKVLTLYWERREDGYHQKRVDHEIDVSKTARSNGKGGGRPRTGMQTGRETGRVTGDVTESQTGSETKQQTETATGEGGGSGHPPSSILHPPSSSLLPATTQPPSSTQGEEQPRSPGGAQRPRLPRRRSDPEGSPKTAATWAAYSEAYRERYSVDPVRNATVNGQLAQVVKQLGLEESPHVARFYVTHSRSVYVGAKHAVSLLLRDCTGLRTEWATGRRVTDTEARQQDRTAQTGEVFAKLIAESEP